MSAKVFVFILDGKTLLEQPSSEFMPLVYEVGQGLVLNELALIVADVGGNDGGRVPITVQRQGERPDLFCKKCGGSLGIASNKPHCDKKVSGECVRPKPKTEEPNKEKSDPKKD